MEGSISERLARTRARSRRLRDQKIREAMVANNGRLTCEVPGCGFDFFETYGELGRGFAHVHHVRLLARNGRTKTAVKDLKVVCANCHAMIHIGGKCRRLQEIHIHR